jgi:hypothetical protein
MRIADADLLCSGGALSDSVLRIECKFWLADDGWNGSSEQPSITVQAGSFVQANSDMELALGQHIEVLLHGAQRSEEHAA